MYGLTSLPMRASLSHCLRAPTRVLNQLREKSIFRTLITPKQKEATQDLSKSDPQFPRKIFSGIQPTGSLHLGNYLGAVKKWTQLQNAKENVSYCIVDMHSITLPQNPAELRENTYEMAATMLACGIDPDTSTLFVQSAVKEHAELCWILSCMTTMARLGHLPQYKEKTKKIKDVPLGLYVYPVLQAADILLYKATDVPVGEDQIQHIQLAQHLAKTFNTRYGNTFPICHAMIESKDASRIKSLRDPSRKMSKSDGDLKSTIFLMDEPEDILEKFKKALTDFTSDVSYSPLSRPGVSNLVAIYALVTNKTIEAAVEEAKPLNTAKFKERVAEAVIEHLRPMRNSVKKHLQRRAELTYVLENGADKARKEAERTIEEIRHKMGLGAINIPPPALVEIPEEVVATPMKATSAKAEKLNVRKVIKDAERPIVPKQQLRVEKTRRNNFEVKINMNNSESKNEPNSPKIVKKETAKLDKKDAESEKLPLSNLIKF